MADLGGYSRSDVFGERYMAMSGDELRALADRHPGHPASRQIGRHLRLADVAAFPADETG